MKTLLHIQMNISQLLQRAVEEELAPHGLHHGQGRMLNIIRREAPITQVELGRFMDVKAATITNMLKPLAKQGLIERQTDPVTNRAQIVTLTQEGEAAYKQVRNAWARIEKRMRTGLADQDMETAFPILEKILISLGGSDPQQNINRSNNRRTT